jgi:hypothetical protein
MSDRAVTGVFGNRTAVALRIMKPVTKSEDRGSSMEPHGNFPNRTKRSPASIFYLPCQAEDPSQSFFVDYKDEGREILDAEVWIRNTVVPFRVPRSPEIHACPPGQHGELNHAIIDNATEEWRRSRLHEGEGNDRFWTYAVKLRTGGMSLNQIEAKLYEEAQYAKHPKERRAQIRSIMKSLQGSWRKAA